MKIQFGTAGSQYHLKSVRFGTTGTTATAATGSSAATGSASTTETTTTDNTTANKGKWNDKFDHFTNE